MSEHLRDPELDRLVHELNRRAERERPRDAESGDDLADEGDFSGGAGAADAGATPAADPVPAMPAMPEPPAVPEKSAMRAPRAKRSPVPRAEEPDLERAEAAAWLDRLPEPPARVSLEAGEALGRLLAEALRRGGGPPPATGRAPPQPPG